MPTTQPHPHSILRHLRDLIPHRPVASHELRPLAELQANHLRWALGITEARFDTDAIGALPRIRIRRDPDLPTSGLSYWDGHAWSIVLNPTDPPTRQRFSLLHELHHIISHPHRRRLFGASAASNDPLAEQTADYFAACALMPKLHVKRRFGRGVQHPLRLARAFNVSPAAMRYRLHQLGLTDTAARCSTTSPGPANMRRPQKLVCEGRAA